MDSQQCRIQEDATVEWIPFAVVMFGNKWDSDDTVTPLVAVWTCIIF